MTRPPQTPPIATTAPATKRLGLANGTDVGSRGRSRRPSNETDQASQPEATAGGPLPRGRTVVPGPWATGAVSGGVGDWIRQHRTAAGLTQEELSERADVSVRAVRDLERGRVRYPRPSTLQLLAGALGLDGDSAASFVKLARHSSAPPPPESSPPLNPTTPKDSPTVIVITSLHVWDCLSRMPELLNHSAPPVLVALAIVR